jgi:hypothetical protein
LRHDPPFQANVDIPVDSIPTTWGAFGGENKGSHFSYQLWGHSPEEAVAKLWLALKKNIHEDTKEN